MKMCMTRVPSQIQADNIRQIYTMGAYHVSIDLLSSCFKQTRKSQKGKCHVYSLSQSFSTIQYFMTKWHTVLIAGGRPVAVSLKWHDDLWVCDWYNWFQLASSAGSQLDAALWQSVKAMPTSAAAQGVISPQVTNVPVPLLSNGSHAIQMMGFPG